MPQSSSSAKARRHQGRLLAGALAAVRVLWALLVLLPLLVLLLTCALPARSVVRVGDSVGKGGPAGIGSVGDDVGEGGQVQGNATEEQIVREAGQDSGPRLWDMPPGAPTDGIELVPPLPPRPHLPHLPLFLPHPRPPPPPWPLTLPVDAAAASRSVVELVMCTCAGGVQDEHAA